MYFTILHIWIVYRSDAYDDTGVGDAAADEYEGSDDYVGDAAEDDERM